MNLESKLEKYFTRRVKSLGGLSIKLLPTFFAGLPDRMILLPDGVVHFVELKQRGGRLSRKQVSVHEMFERLGFKVAVLWSKEDIDSFFKILNDERNI